MTSFDIGSSSSIEFGLSHGEGDLSSIIDEGSIGSRSRSRSRLLLLGHLRWYRSSGVGEDCSLFGEEGLHASPSRLRDKLVALIAVTVEDELLLDWGVGVGVD